jgi:hypothetical protein
VLFDAYIMADWSAANVPGPPGGGPNGIWVAVGRPGAPDVVAPRRTRVDAAEVVTGELRGLLAAGLRVLVGFDVAYGYPVGTARALGLGAGPPWRATWGHLTAAIRDDGANASNRFEVAAAANRAIGAPPGPFWGTPWRRPPDALQPTKPVFPFALPGGGALAEHRATERLLRRAGHQPKSVWQLAYAGSVGSQALVGIPHLVRLRHDAALAAHSRVWPFETGFTADPLAGADRGIVHAEVYPSLLHPDPALHPVHDARQVLALVAAFRAMDAAGTLGAAFAPPEAVGDAAALDEEGWVLVPRGPA